MISQKATIICIYEILKKYSDENHTLTAAQICDKLKKIYDVDMERRAVYRNIDALRSLGIEIEGYVENREGYYLIDRDFDSSEIRLLCDAVAASDMIKPEHSKAIITKLMGTQSIYQSRMLQRTVYLKNGDSDTNKQLFYNIDTLNIAINQNAMVSAIPLEYNFDAILTPKKGEHLIFSPYATVWVDGAYYIIGKCDGDEDLTHFRIDHLKDIVILERSVDILFGSFHPAQYAEKHIKKNGEPDERYEILCDANLWNGLVEEFGQNVSLLRNSDKTITIRIITNHSQVKSWIMRHLCSCEVLYPKKLRDEIQTEVKIGYQKYWM